MKPSAKPIRYGRPCMADLPPELGRMIFEAIKNSPPFDRAKLERKCVRAERRLDKIIAELDRNEVAAK